MKDYIDIIKGMQKNETRAQMAFYDMFYRPVYQSAYATVGNHDEAEEIMQDSFLKIFLNTGLLQDEPNAMTRFLKRITVNQAIDVLRKKKHFFMPLDDDGSMDVEEEDDAEDEFELTVSDIKEGINKLSMTYRDIISLRLLNELSFAEVAKELDLNASTVRVQYSRGISKLRTFLKQKIYAYE
jgi:RNA polymerase sigma-70 factor (ECF subfamily)